MARNVMSLESVKNKVHRSAFDLSGKRAFTAKVGELLPCYVREVLPGDRFDIDLGHFTRTTPVNTAAYCRIKENVDFYFVPMRLLWDKFPQWVIETDSPMFARDLYSPAAQFTTCPYTTVGDFLTAYDEYTGGSDYTSGFGKQGFVKLAELLGYGSLIRCYEEATSAVKSNLKNSSDVINLWRFAAYQKVHQDYYRYQQWEASQPQRYNFDYVLSDSDLYIQLSQSNFDSVDSFFGLRMASYHKDYFTGLLPRAQFGDTAVAGPVSGTFVFSRTGSNTNTTPNLYANLTDSHRTDVLASDWSMTANSKSTAGISILAIRQAQVLQKYREIILSGNYDYKTQLQKHWNVSTSKMASDMCIRLGGYDSNVEIGEVINTNLSGSDVADIKGRGVSRGSSRIRFDNNNFGNEYGIIIGIYSSYPLLDYSCNLGLDRNLTLVTSGDYPKPEFDSIGMETVDYSEYYTAFDSSPSAVLITKSLGYAPRYANWKTERDFVYGGFARDSAYANWVSAVDPEFFYTKMTAGSSRALSYNSFLVNPALLDSIFVAQVTGFTGSYDDYFSNDQLLINLFIGNSSVRNLSEDGLPY